jgi:outer membrane protein assembly factor BamB
MDAGRVMFLARSTIVVVAAAGLVSCSSERSTTGFLTASTSADVIPGRVVELSRASAEVLRDIPVGPDPLLAVAAGNGVWTVNLDDSTVSRVDATTGAVTSPAVGEVVGIASDGTDVWISRDGNQLARLDGATGEERASFTLAGRPLFAPRDAGFLVVAEGSVWLTVPSELGSSAPQAMWKIDPTTGEVLSKIRIGRNPHPPVVAGDRIWFATEEMVFETVDVGSERVRDVDLGAFPGSVVEGGGRTWASAGSSIFGLDLDGNGERVRIEHPGEARALAWVDGRLWVATATGVDVVDPSTGEVERSADLAPPSDDEGPIVMVPIGDSVWVSVETH